jgi:uncharacterized membrane protein
VTIVRAVAAPPLLATLRMNAELFPSTTTRDTLPLPILLLGIAGGALVGARRELSPRARAAATVGGLALIGAAAHRPLGEAVRRAGTRRRAASVHTSLVVDHPVEEVFAFIRDFENFPRFIGALREVRDFGDGRCHWCASTPSGGTVEWDTVTTKYVPNRVIAWRSVGAAPLKMSGLVRLRPEGRSTRVTLTMDYRVVDGGLADAIAALATPSRTAELERQIHGLPTCLDLAHAESEEAGLPSDDQ